MKKIFVLFATVFMATSIFAATENQDKKNSASVANRRTAIRYLQNAKLQAAEKHWKEANSLSKVGLEYDDSVADLWYISAISLYSLGEKRANVLPIIEKSLNERQVQWVDYNRDNARILFADILCSTLRFEEAIKVLDFEPFIYSSDAEVIRVKSYYNLAKSNGKYSEDALKKARLRIDTARKVYPEDIRFADIFYNYEYKICFLDKLYSNESKTEENKIEIPSDVQKIADAFASSIRTGRNYKKLNDDLKLLSIVFSSDSDEKVRLLKSFNSENYKSVHFAEHALRNGILTETQAVDCFYKFADSSNDNPIRIDVLESFISNLTDEKMKTEFSQYLNSFNGIITSDTDGDLEDNMKIVYKRGRPESIEFDKNQDGIKDWSAICDFGVPQSLHLEDKDLNIVYGNWPSIHSAIYDVKGNEKSTIPTKSKLAFKLIADSLLWTPFEIVVDSSIKENLNQEFFIPTIPEKVRAVNGVELLLASSYYTMSSNERPNTTIQVSVLNGIAQSAKYFEGDIENGRLYAMAQFEKGIPVLRFVDSDNDGLFETTEYYGHITDLSKKYITENDELEIITNLFGAPAKNTGFYVKQIQLDQNGDTVPDFVEEYTEGYGKISSWDTNSDGSWDVKYVRHPQKNENDVLKEDAIFHRPFTNEIVTVSTENGISKSVSIGNKTRMNVFVGEVSKDFYWLAEKSSKSIEMKIIQEFFDEKQGVSKVLSMKDKSDNEELYHVVKVGNMIFAEKLDYKK